MSRAHWQESREIVERIVVCGDLVLETPACFGGGEGDSLTDMPLMLDPLEGRALLTGTSIAGALRSYLRERECGYRQRGVPDALHNLLFGRQEDDEGEQSWLITCDALSEQAPQIELRDGVALDPKTRTAESKKLFDFELLEAGTRFPLRVELLIPQEQREKLVEGLAIALQGLERGEIALGARKRRGLGRCRVSRWQVLRYDLTTAEGLLVWLTQAGTAQTRPSIADLLGAQADVDRRESFTIQATFGLDGSLLIRSGQGAADEPDIIHLRSRRGDKLKPILSGTSLAGALRGRALRIAQTMGEKAKAERLVNDLFGLRIRSSEDKPTASRLITAETEIGLPLNLVQTRVKIDRFTGGSFPTALFSEQPVWGQKETTLTVEITLQQPTEAQIGLVLLLLKDLWTGDLPLGGEISVGRGRLIGRRATLTYRRATEEIQCWTIAQNGEQMRVEGDQKRLEAFVDAFVKGEMMKSEIKTGRHCLQTVPVPDNLTELKPWLAEQARAYRLRWLLAHADDGVIWGEMRDERLLHLSGDAFPNLSPPLRAATLQQARLFGPDAELLMWRNDGHWQARVIQDGVGENGEYYGETHLLWGSEAEQDQDGFVLLRQGNEGLRHAPPLPQDARLPARLQVRHYLAYDPDGQAYIACSRLVALQGGAE